MQVKIEDQSTVKKIIHIEIEGEDVTAELDKAYRDLGKSASIKGFRKGKIPRKVLESRFSKDVNADIVSRLIQDSYSEAIKSQSIVDIVGPPSVMDELPELEQGKPFNFSINVEVKPVLSDIEFKGIELRKNVYKPSDEEIDAQLHMIRQTMSTKKTVTEERPAKESDFVLIDYEGFVDGKPFEHTPKIENYLMDIGSKNMPEEFSAKLTGAIPPTDLEIEVVYEDDHTENELAGKTVVYKVAMKEIQEKELPPLDDTLAEKLGQFENLEGIKDAIRSNLEAGYKVRTHQELSEQIFTTLLEKIDFEVPDVLVESELNGIIAETEQAYKQHNITLEDAGVTKDIIRTRYRDVAEQQARRHLLLGKIIEQEKLELTEDEMEEAFAGMARSMHATVEQVKKMFKTDAAAYQLEYIKMIELEKKAVNHIIDNSNIIEVEPEAEDAPSPTAVEDDTASIPSISADMQ
ncbi:MAG: trigger factor [Desulfamplus sp.]|nr:trigger factor [Desulfamplus sp.]